MLLNAGYLHNEIARQSWEAGRPVFGSSANTSLMGSKYKASDIETAVLDAVYLVVDYGLSKYHNDLGRSSTIIDFTNFSVIRVGVMFDQLQNQQLVLIVCHLFCLYYTSFYCLPV